MREELPIDDFVTHTIDGLENVNQSIEALHSGDCLRAIVKINSYNLASEPMKIKQLQNVKVAGGYLKQLRHESKVNNCDMTFSIFLPDKAQRADPPPPAMYYLSGLTCTDENARTKACVFEHAAKYGLAVVFPDTSARGVEIEG